MAWRGDETIPAVYAPIAAAYAYVELIIMGDPDEGESCWELITRGGRNPADVVRLLRDQLRREAAQPFGDSEKTAAAMALAVEQAELPLFATYVAGKLGAC